MTQRTYASPIGELHLIAESGRLVGLRFGSPGDPAGHNPREADTGSGVPEADRRVLDAAVRQLGEYFTSRRKAFRLPIALRGTPFQLRVWSELAKVPFGQTISYRQLAERVGNPGASRAVGSANGANALALIVPCHRVIAADGTLAGFAGGVAVKRALLEHERAGAGLFALACG
ncbi:MAG: methylated-DNA--[protein]-cysteine S-methyltransferase [Phycisphaeraceae bacterium]